MFSGATDIDADSDTNSTFKCVFDNYKDNYELDKQNITKKRKTKSKSNRLSESESSSSWENKQASNELMSNFGSSILLKTPERRLKLTIRVKRSPTTSNNCSAFNQEFGPLNIKSVDNEPEYEILRTEGIDCNGISETDSTTSLVFAGMKRTKRKKRHKHKKKRNKKLLDSHEFDYNSKICEDNINNTSDSNDIAEKKCNSQSNFTTAKRVKLMFGNEMKILNIPDKIQNSSNDSEQFLINKSNANLLPAKSILVTNVFN